jgi:uncharacterized protein YdeI (YjbR/CyaY-like superfamily)
MQKTFRGQLESGLIAQDHSEGRYWTAIRIPFDPIEIWPVRKALRVRGTINGFPFRTSLFGSRASGLLLMVNRTMQKEAKVKPGSIANIVIEPDLEDRSAAPPPELAKLLKSDRSVKKWYEQLNYSMRKYIADAVAKPKSAEARQRQAELWVERMMLTMEGEVEPPPILQAAFRRQPLARAGWDAMTPIQRRTHLLAIFLNQSPQARAKRAKKTITEAIRIADKKSGANAQGQRPTLSQPGQRPR